MRLHTRVRRKHSRGHELIVAPELHHAPLRNNRDAIRVPYRGKAVRHHEGGAALLRLQVVESSLDLRVDAGVYGRGRDLFEPTVSTVENPSFGS